jgi:hypothetical protein
MIYYLIFNLIVPGIFLAVAISDVGVTFARRRQGLRADLGYAITRALVSGAYLAWTVWLLTGVL